MAHSHAKSEHDLEALIVELRARGERLTPQRLLVLGILAEQDEHLTADAILARVQAQYPYVNASTVYRALDWLSDLGLAYRTDLGGGVQQFGLVGPTPHHHLICLRCQHAIEFEDALVEPLRAQLEARYGFMIRLDHLAVFGICDGCREEPSEATPA